MKRKFILSIIIITLLISAVFFLLKSGTKEIKVNKNGGETLPVSDVATMYVAAEGKVEAMPGMEIEVGIDMLSARIDRIFVKQGDWIKKGQLLARLESKDIEARFKSAERELAVAKARLKEIAAGSREEEIKRAAAALEAVKANRDTAKINFERYESLYREGVAPKSFFDEKENFFKVAVAKVKEAEEEKRLLENGPRIETIKLYEESVAQAAANAEYYKRLLEKSVILSPITGKVIRKYLDDGESVIPETPILAVADVAQIRINAEVDETDVGRIAVGDPAEITSDAYPGKVFHGEILDISDYVGARKVKPNNPAKNLDMKVVQVKILLNENTPFKLGMTVDVRIKPKQKYN